jgi:hypothetical protein
MALSENGRRDAARPRSILAPNRNPWAAPRAHFCYEEAGQTRPFLSSGTTIPWLVASHLSWHLALGDLRAGDAEGSGAAVPEAFDVRGPPRGR